MARGLESRKPLDSNVEKKNLEGTYSHDTSSQTPSSWDLTEETRKKDAERKLAQLFGGRFGGYSGIDSSKMALPKSKFSAIDIGKETINTPTQAKQEARQQEAVLENERNIESITK